jgi:asparagine synthase (glutamine-hydrolysing)
MCGILGIVQADDINTDNFYGALDAMSHRGPDNAGLKLWPDQNVGLGHRRLSIIDLSPAGHNPICNEDGSVWVVFNGEIYNFRSLRDQLERLGHKFKSNTDTEVILHAYEEWGDDHVHRLRGMFAYALYDRRSKGMVGNVKRENQNFRILLVRDRLGIKPLFYYRHKGMFIFASEIKAILAFPGVDRMINRSAIFDYLTYLYIPPPKTAYAHLQKLPAGHMLVFEKKQIWIKQYWEISLYRPSPVQTFDQACELIRETLEEAVNLHTISDVPVGVFLSGGIDSSTVTALMAQMNSTPIKTFSIGFDIAEHSETDYARELAEYHRTQHFERLVGVESAQRMLSHVVFMFDEPFASGSAIPTYYVSALAREHVKVALSGDGGDEIFYGYNWYTSWLRRRSFDRIPLTVRRRIFRRPNRVWPHGWRGKGFIADLISEPLEQYGRLLNLFSPSEKRKILNPEWCKEFSDYDDYWYFRKYWRPELDPMTRMQYLDLKTYLPEFILTKVDRASMAVSLEVRPPFLDHVLVEQLFSIPIQYRAPNGQKKYLLKAVAQDFLPERIQNRTKKGFSSPLSGWMRTHVKWSERKLGQKNHYLLREGVEKIPWLLKNGTKIWALLVLQEWLANESIGRGI